MTQSDTWAPQACTLPQEERPLRQAEFSALFAAALRGINRVDAIHLRLILDPSFERLTRDLTDREVACCSFFTFTLERSGDDLWLDIQVPAAQAAVLAALANQAEASRRSDR
jgi:hypothetical protein